MLSAARRLAGVAKIVFKPHPLLRRKLASDSYWGPRQTDDYWSQWAELGPDIVSDGEYAAEFNRSDAIIHDCGSFTAEYLATGKPAMYLWRDPNLPQRFNAIGRCLLAAHYKGEQETDVDRFIFEVVLNRRDPMAEKRYAVARQYVLSPGNATASENIFNWIDSSIFGDGNSRT
jgi:CDP-glycerol glycerophosphotransferase (TagB/SpsB family)